MNVRLRARQLRRALETRAIRVGLVVLATAGLAVVALLAAFPGLAPGAGLNLIVTFAAAIAGVYLSQALLVQRVFRTDRDRVASPGTVRDRYADAVSMLSPTHLNTIADVEQTAMPVSVVNEVFVGPDPAGQEALTEEVYTLPPELSAFLEPRHDELIRRFENEGRPNRRLVRVTGVTPDGLELAETSYFRTYCTNLSPDFGGETGTRSLRAAFDRDLLADDDSGLSPLSETPFSDALSGGGLVLTTDGRTIAGMRPLDVAVDELELVDSFGDHLGVAEVADEGIHGALLAEAAEALQPFTPDAVTATYGLGMVRRLDWLGQPNLHALVLVDAPDELSHSGTEHLDTVGVDVDGWSAIEPSDLDDPALARATASALVAAATRAGYEPGVTLQTSLELWLRRTQPNATL